MSPMGTSAPGGERQPPLPFEPCPLPEKRESRASQKRPRVSFDPSLSPSARWGEGGRNFQGPTPTLHPAGERRWPEPRQKSGPSPSLTSALPVVYVEPGMACREPGDL